MVIFGVFTPSACRDSGFPRAGDLLLKVPALLGIPSFATSQGLQIRLGLLEREDPAGKGATFEGQNHASSPASHRHKVPILQASQRSQKDHIRQGGSGGSDPSEGMGAPEFIEKFDLFDGAGQYSRAGVKSP